MVDNLNNKYDVVIVGAGPAGLKAAEVLTRAGKSVLVLEKNKVIGDKLCAGGMPIKKYSKSNFPFEKIDARFFQTMTFHFLGKERRISLDKSLMAVVERTNLGAYMADCAIRAGAKIETSTQVEEVSREYIRVKDKKIYFDYLIGADGSNSLVRRFLKLSTEKVFITIYYEVDHVYENLDLFYDSGLMGDGYGAIFPHKTYTQLGVTLDMARDPHRNIKEVLDEWIEKQNLDCRGGVLKEAHISYDYRGFKFGNIFLVGDAGGFASGLTAGGISNAIVSGQEAAKNIIDPTYTCPDIKHILRLKFIHEKIIKPLMRSKNPLVLRLVYEFSALSSYPLFYNVFSKLNPLFAIYDVFRSSTSKH